jgi:hypothetical protein
VREQRTGLKSVQHPIVGDLDLNFQSMDLDLNFQSMDLTADRGLLILVFSAEPGSPSHTAMRLLANLAASGEEITSTALEPAL